MYDVQLQLYQFEDMFVYLLYSFYQLVFQYGYSYLILSSILNFSILYGNKGI